MRKLQKKSDDMCLDNVLWEMQSKEQRDKIAQQQQEIINQQCTHSPTTTNYTTTNNTTTNNTSTSTLTPK